MKDRKKKPGKSGTRDQVEGRLHQVKGDVRETTGKVFGSPKLENRGKAEKRAGKVQEKTGQVKRV
ncbi:MAG: CsbD family protein, partial [bacterium]